MKVHSLVIFVLLPAFAAAGIIFLWPWQAASASRSISGQIVSIDKESGTILLKEDETGRQIELKAQKEELLDLVSQGERVRIEADQYEDGLKASKIIPCCRGCSDPTGTRRRLWKAFEGGHGRSWPHSGWGRGLHGGGHRGHGGGRHGR